MTRSDIVYLGFEAEIKIAQRSYRHACTGTVILHSSECKHSNSEVKAEYRLGSFSQPMHSPLLSCPIFPPF